MFRFLKRNDSEVITPEVVDVPVMTIQSNIVIGPDTEGTCLV